MLTGIVGRVIGLAPTAKAWPPAILRHKFEPICRLGEILPAPATLESEMDCQPSGGAAAAEMSARAVPCETTATISPGLRRVRGFTRA